MSFPRIAPTNTYRSDQIDSQEYIDLGASGLGKKVVLFDSAGNEISNGSGSSITSGTTTVASAGTAVQVSVASVPCKGVWLSGDTVAAKLLYVGDASVVANASGQ